MDDETKGWIDLLEARIAELEDAHEAEDADDKHTDNMRVSVAIGLLCLLELLTALYAVYATVRHG